MSRDQLLAAITAAAWNISAAGVRLNMHPNTVRYQLRRLGIERPNAPARPAESHPPVALLLRQLEQSRARAQLLCRTYLPTPARAVALRHLECEQRELREAIRKMLGESGGGQGMTRQPFAPGAMRPAWHVRAFG